MQLGLAEQNGIDINQIAADGLTEKEFPAASPFRVLISEAAHQQMWAHARSTLVDRELIKEVGGVLIGDLYCDDKGPFLEVTAAIVAEHTRNEGTEVTFTPETWAQLNRVKDAQHPGQRMVGWYHTHPNFGIFLSDRDQFLHRHSFPQPWAVAHVIDPVQDLEGLFVWKGGAPREANEFWVGADRRMGQKTPEPKPSSPIAPAAEPSSLSKIMWLVPSGIALVLVLVAVVISFARDMEQRQRDALIIRALESEKVELDRAFQILRALRADVERVSKQSSSDSAEMKGQAQQLEKGLAEVKGQTQQLEGGLEKLSALTKTLQRRIQGLEVEAQRPEGGAAK